MSNGLILTLSSAGVQMDRQDETAASTKSHVNSITFVIAFEVAKKCVPVRLSSASFVWTVLLAIESYPVGTSIANESA